MRTTMDGRLRSSKSHALRDDWSAFALPDALFTDFAPGSRVVDLGCGNATQLAALQAGGCVAIGIDVNLTILARAQAQGLRVLAAAAEGVPLRTASADGVVCKVVLPYTDEARAVAEIGRLLRIGGKAVLCSHGAGYYLRYLMVGPSWRRRIYAGRTLVNTWLYALTGRRLPGFLGDTLYQSRRRLALYHEAAGLVIDQNFRSRRFLGFPVFIYQVTSRSSRIRIP